MKFICLAILLLVTPFAVASSRPMVLEGDPDLPFMRTLIRKDSEGLTVIVNGVQPDREKLPYLFALPTEPSEIRLVGYGVLGSAVQNAKPIQARPDDGSVYGIGYLALGFLWLITMPRRLMQSGERGRGWRELLLFVGYVLLGICLFPILAFGQERRPNSDVVRIDPSKVENWCVDNNVHLGTPERGSLRDLSAKGWSFYAVGSVSTPAKPVLIRYGTKTTTLPVVFSNRTPDQLTHEIVTVGDQLGRVDDREIILAKKLRNDAIHPDLYDLMKRDDFATYSRADLSRDEMLTPRTVHWSAPIPTSKPIGRHLTTSISTGIVLIVVGAVIVELVALLWPGIRQERLLLVALALALVLVAFWYGERQFVRSYSSKGFLPEARLSAQLWMIESIRKKPLQAPFSSEWRDRLSHIRYPLSGLAMSGEGPYGMSWSSPHSGEGPFEVTFYDSQGKPHPVIADGKLTEYADLVGRADW